MKIEELWRACDACSEGRRKILRSQLAVPSKGWVPRWNQFVFLITLMTHVACTSSQGAQVGGELVRESSEAWGACCWEFVREGVLCSQLLPAWIPRQAAWYTVHLSWRPTTRCALCLLTAHSCWAPVQPIGSAHTSTHSQAQFFSPENLGITVSPHLRLSLHTVDTALACAIRVPPNRGAQFSPFFNSNSLRLLHSHY